MEKNPREITRVQQMIDWWTLATRVARGYQPWPSVWGEKMLLQLTTKWALKEGNISKSLCTKFLSGGFLFSTLFSALDFQIWKKTQQKACSCPPWEVVAQEAAGSMVNVDICKGVGDNLLFSLSFPPILSNACLSGTFSVNGNWVHPGVPSDTVPSNLNS